MDLRRLTGCLHGRGIRSTLCGTITFPKLYEYRRVFHLSAGAKVQTVIVKLRVLPITNLHSTAFMLWMHVMGHHGSSPTHACYGGTRSSATAKARAFIEEAPSMHRASCTILMISPTDGVTLFAISASIILASFFAALVPWCETPSCICSSYFFRS